ncbi:MAG: 4-(cytidine 5'-diphospho)-2-C-methyl-D-erythritol kinase [Candidatus Margulisiibacteriota bacterium]
MSSQIVRAYAKINLGLHVSGPRPDGYHFIASLFQTIDLYDVLDIRIRSEPGISLTVTGIPVPADAKNLVVRAYRAAAERLPFGVDVALSKHIPTGAGLGGGSADAAVFLLAMRELHPSLSAAKVAEIAPTLGADVPFFLTGGTALVQGIGEIIQPMPPTDYAAFVMFFPPVSVSTADAYDAYDRLAVSPLAAPPPITPQLMRGQDLTNALESAVLQLHPEFEWVLELVQRIVRRRPVMSGSGSTFFLPFNTLKEAQDCQTALNGRLPWTMQVVRPTSGSYSIQV